MDIYFRAWDKKNQEMIYDNVNSAILRATKIMAYTTQHEYYDFTQFTGIYDQQDLPIFEGDIVEAYTEHDDVCNKFVVSMPNHLLAPNVYEYFVIGNKFETPELMEKENNE